MGKRKADASDEEADFSDSPIKETKKKGPKSKKGPQKTPEQERAEAEAKRLTSAAVTHGILSKGKQSAQAKPLQLSKALQKVNSSVDIIKKGSRKNKYLFAFPGFLAPAGEGKLGQLDKLDTRNPILYVDFPQGRMKLQGTRVKPRSRYITINNKRANFVCDDVFDSILVFSEASWIGTPEENPKEEPMPLPEGIKVVANPKFSFDGGAGSAVDSAPSISRFFSAGTPGKTLKDERGGDRVMPKRAATKKAYTVESGDEEDEAEPSDSDAAPKRGRAKKVVEVASGSDSDLEIVNVGDVGDVGTRRQPRRSSGAAVSYAQVSDDDDDDDDENGDSDSAPMKKKAAVSKPGAANGDEVKCKPTRPAAKADAIAVDSDDDVDAKPKTKGRTPAKSPTVQAKAAPKTATIAAKPAREPKGKSPAAASAQKSAGSALLDKVAAEKTSPTKLKTVAPEKAATINKVLEAAADPFGFDDMVQEMEEKRITPQPSPAKPSPAKPTAAPKARQTSLFDAFRKK